MSELWFSIFDRDIRVVCEDSELLTMLTSVYGSMQITPAKTLVPNLDYHLYRSDKPGKEYCVHREGQKPVYSDDDGLFLYQFEKDMTIKLEGIRQDLYFLHAAALEYNGNIHLLVAESGGGKSTTAWALMHHGFNYASDELAPIELEEMKVNIYPHALCQKTSPPEPYSLPAKTLYTSRTLHIPTEAMPCKIVADSLDLQSIFFVRYDPQAALPTIKTVSAGEAGARVYANGLNQLAHASDGLDAALEIAQHCNCYELQSAGLKETCELVAATLGKDMSS